MPTLEQPKTGLDALAVLDAQGSRQYVYPDDVKGRFTKWRRVVHVALIVIFVAMPWIHIGGHPMIFIDIGSRQFFLFGRTFNSQDFYLMFWVVAGSGFVLIIVSALWGRVWCGWACPQTAWLDTVYRRVERWIEGPAGRRRRERKNPTTTVVLKKVLKHVIFFVLAFLIAHVFLSYFVSLPKMFGMMSEAPGEHVGTFAFVMVLTILMYLNFWWFREQLCIIICPYGRLQSALSDHDSVVIGYDARRGEPRGKKGKASASARAAFEIVGSGAADAEKADDKGDCIDCGRCVRVCPTGIDIRDGMQLECIGCAACIDACDDIMDKVGRPRGLVRYDSERGLTTKKRRFWRGRVVAYLGATLAFAVLAAFVFAGHQTFEAKVHRLQGSPYAVTDGVVTNHLMVHLVNKNPGPSVLTLSAPDGQPFTFEIPTPQVEIASFSDIKVPVLVRLPAAEGHRGMTVTLSVSDSASAESKDVDFKFLGPFKRTK